MLHSICLSNYCNWGIIQRICFWKGELDIKLPWDFKNDATLSAAEQAYCYGCIHSRTLHLPKSQSNFSCFSRYLTWYLLLKLWTENGDKQTKQECSQVLGSSLGGGGTWLPSDVVLILITDWLTRRGQSHALLLIADN